ncbi:MAG: polymer-forming cytoskeletal protein [Bacteroidia bacterium]|nr:polymer-forming cytoskeletal protein [Bacteroidales bacterium]NCD41211.1 polymer-forming cytoskeletal protein [Bacteroidia bacterium]
MAKLPEMDTTSANLIQSGTEIKGDVITNGNIRIDGTLNGNLECKGKLIIGKTGVIDGTVNCSNAEVEGNLRVKMNVQGLLILKSTAKLFGDIVVSKLAIEPGATFTGTCKMDEEGMPQKKEQNLFEASASKQ